MKALTTLKKTQGETVQISATDILDLRFFLSGLLLANKHFSETVSWWLTKNEKKLDKAFAAVLAEDKAMDDEYIEKNAAGHYRIWDKVLAPPLAKLRTQLTYMKENPVTEAGEELDKFNKAVSDIEKEIKAQEELGLPEDAGRPAGFMCWMKQLENGKTIYVDNEGVQMPEVNKEMDLFVSDPEKRKEYYKKKEEFSSVLRPIKVEQIQRELLSELNILSMGATQQGAPPQKMNRELFYKTLVIGGADADEDDE